jgi:hypothetical protein
MTWYYAENNDRRGPVDEAAFGNLVRGGTIRPETLVWRDGMANWTPLAQSGYDPAVPVSPTPADETEAPRQPAVPMGVCSESGRILPRSELVEIDGKLVSAEYKHLVLQRIREGISGDGAIEDAEAIAQRVEAAGWNISASDCIGRGWMLVRRNFWLCVGSTFLVHLLIFTAGLLPPSGLILQGPLVGGLYWMILKCLRGEPATVGDAFQGFSRGWGHLIGVSLLTTLAIVPCLVPGLVAVALVNRGTGNPSIGGVLLGIALLLIGVGVAIYLTVGWIFALPLVTDKRLEFWPAMTLSRRIVGMHWWQIFGLLFLTGVLLVGILLAGVLLFFLVTAIGFGATGDPGIAVAIGVLLGFLLLLALLTLLPLAFSALMVAYEDIFRRRELT